MRATIGTKSTPHQRIKLMIVAALLTLSLGLGMAATAQPVGATQVCYQEPHRGPVCTIIK